MYTGMCLAMFLGQHFNFIVSIRDNKMCNLLVRLAWESKRDNSAKKSNLALFTHPHVL